MIKLTNENQKKVTDQYRSNWDEIFKNSKISDKVVKQVEDSISEYQKQAQELWFKDGSCTGGSPEQRD